MRRLNEKISSLLLGIVLSLGITSPAKTDPSQNTHSRILRFQQTMAEKGQATAQYKLAMMYETGMGVEKDIEQARLWYGRAALQEYKPAKHRLTYLDIQQNGFKPVHQIWLKELSQDAQNNDGEALLLLGQMQATGIGMPKNYDQAISALRRASALNTPGADLELAHVEASQSQALEIEQARTLAEQKLKQAQDEQRQIENLEKQRILRQKQLEDQQRQREAQIIAEQQHLLDNKYKQKSQSAPAHQITDNLSKPSSRVQREAEYVSEPDNSPCSGRNRFAATCR